MRPPRIIIAGAFFVTTVFLTFVSLRSSHNSHKITTSSSSSPKTGLESFFSFRAPFSLFPPNAIITLTHDNTTAFLARPAAFGPSLPTEGLKGQVWIGSGFGDVAAGGELGCSDVPGWEEGLAKSGAAVPNGGKAGDRKTSTIKAKKGSQKRAKSEDGPFDDSARPDGSRSKDKVTGPTADDGTDDYLHHPLPPSSVSRPSEKQTLESSGDHADIQSIQEGAEIAGKVVLLSRGGCGFLEKVKWAQRRGSVALIVGDDTKGGPLIQMYARGDTSNVSIPSIFTSYTTAHLLSSLVGPGSFIEDIIDENGKPVMKVHQAVSQKKGSNPTFTSTVGGPRAIGTTRATPRPVSSKVSHRKTSKIEDKPMTTERPGWFKSLFGSRATTGSSRPPSSGELDWVLVDEWKDEDEIRSKKISAKPKKKPEPAQKAEQKTKAKAESSQPPTQDDFVIGVQDWRDPDLVATAKDQEAEKKGEPAPAKDVPKPTATAKNSTPQPTKTGGKKHIGGAIQEIPEYNPSLRGGSITPGSGEYPTKEADGKAVEVSLEEAKAEAKSKGLLTTIFGDDEEDVEFLTPSKSSHTDDEAEEESDGDDEFEGLWVTLTPTSGASPFLDTLLVLVVSPLVTLTVVYSLLLIRSRIRRRRWRAPKSVVERLPVRTYHTIVSPGAQSPRLPSPTSSSVTTPLLQGSSPTRPRPRSRTTTGVPEAGDLIRVNSSPLQVPSIPPRLPEHEKNASGTSEWRKYMGKQVECVICLEDYIEGVSRVMSLPCGHEFHADCITPWLTTRRRTCPICKGDVVRSLARGSPAGSSPHYEAYHDDSDSDAERDIQIQSAESTNNSSSSALPILGDLEAGAQPQPVTRSANSSWRNLLASSFGSSSRSPRLPVTPEDRNR